jgi:hypothetical protein
MQRSAFLPRCLAILWYAPAVLLAQPIATPATPSTTALDTDLQSLDTAAERADAFGLLRELTGRFGRRLTGSPGEHHAADWAMRQMRALGLGQVHAEDWTLQRAWRRGHATARLTAPVTRELAVASYGWSGSTYGAVSGEVVIVDGRVDPASLDDTGWSAKILLVSPTTSDEIRAVADVPALAARALAAHALALIDGIERPGSALLHTGPLGFPQQSSPLPVLDMPKEQRQLLARWVEAGAHPRMRLDVATTFGASPVTERNIVGEIVGALHPEEVILLGAHLDAWDLGPGATDDGTGVAAVLGAARAIRASGVRPDRTLRFVLFSGEEQGLLGSRSYVQQHRADLPQLSCALVMDWGSGPIVRFPLAGHPEMQRSLEGLFASGHGLERLTTSAGFLTFTDAFAFTLAGVPGMAPLQDSPRYDEEAHSPADRRSAVDSVTLESNTRVLALAALWLADQPNRPDLHFSPMQTEQSLQPLRPALDMLGLWNFPQ